MLLIDWDPLFHLAMGSFAGKEGAGISLLGFSLQFHEGCDSRGVRPPCTDAAEIAGGVDPVLMRVC